MTWCTKNTFWCAATGCCYWFSNRLKRGFVFRSHESAMEMEVVFSKYLSRLGFAILFCLPVFGPEGSSFGIWPSCVLTWADECPESWPELGRIASAKVISRNALVQCVFATRSQNLHIVHDFPLTCLPEICEFERTHTSHRYVFEYWSLLVCGCRSTEQSTF